MYAFLFLEVSRLLLQVGIDNVDIFLQVGNLFLQVDFSLFIQLEQWLHQAFTI